MNTFIMDESTHDHHHEVLEMLNQTVHHLSKKNLNVEALGCLEQTLLIKQKMFGTHSRVVRETLRDVVVQTNAIAMTCLEASEFKTCLDMLLHAQRLVTEGNDDLRHIESLHILTLNNLGCYYRRLGKLSEALEVLHEASHVGEGCADNHDVANLSVTHMNICAIESQLGRHEKALEHAQAAVFHCQGELVQDRTSPSSLEEGEDQALDDVMEAESRDEKIIRLAIAYYNLAVELEFAQKVSMSLQVSGVKKKLLKYLNDFLLCCLVV